jgi:hypothetical protein
MPVNGNVAVYDTDTHSASVYDTQVHTIDVYDAEPLAVSYEQFVTDDLDPVIWYRLRETSGTSPANSGSASLTATWTPGAGALGQTGKLGANEAYDFDALVSKIAIADNAAIQALATYTIIGLVHADGFGENNAGEIIHLGALNAFRATGTAGRFTMVFDTGSTDATSTSTDGFLTTGAWLAIFGTYDDAGDRRARLYKGVAGVVTEATYSAQTAATGSRVAPVGAIIGNFSDVRTWDGLIDEIIVCNRVLTSAEMLQYTQLAGV